VGERGGERKRKDLKWVSRIYDINGNTWQITSGEQIAVNGAVDPITRGVVKLTYISNVIWQEVY
jgi:hypothetical protein